MDFLRFPGDASGKDLCASTGDITHMGLIPGWGRSPGGGHDNTLQYSCLKSPRERGAWRATVSRSGTQLKQLSTYARMHHPQVVVLASCKTSMQHLWCQIKISRISEVLTRSSLSWASRNCSGHCHESRPLCHPGLLWKMLSVVKKAGRGLGGGKRTSTKPSPPFSLDDCEV